MFGVSEYLINHYFKVIETLLINCQMILNLRKKINFENLKINYLNKEKQKISHIIKKKLIYSLEKLNMIKNMR